MQRIHLLFLFFLLVLFVPPANADAFSSKEFHGRKASSKIVPSAAPSSPAIAPHGKTAAAVARQTNLSIATIQGTPFQIKSYSDGSVAVHRNGVQQFYGQNASGVYLWAGGRAWGPSVPANRSLPFGYTELGVTGPSGNGTAESPWVLRCMLMVPDSQLQIEQQISYINGTDYIAYEWLVQNNGTESQEYTLFHAADLFLNGDDRGTGYYNPETGSIGGRNRAQDQFELFVPATPASAYQESDYNSIWQAISNANLPGSGFNNTTVASYIDNGAGLEWRGRTLFPGETHSIRDYVSFSDQPLNPVLTADPVQSKLEVVPSDVLADGRASAKITVTLLDSQGRPVPGKQIELRSDRASDRVTQPGIPSDASGQAVGYIRSATAGVATITANDLSDDLTLTSQALMNFVDPPTSDFATAVREFTQSGQDDIAQAAAHNNNVAEVGRYFSGELTADVASAITDLILDSVSLGEALGGLNASLASTGLRHIGTPGYKAALHASWGGYTTDSAAQRHFYKPLYDVFHNNRVLTGPVIDKMLDAGKEFVIEDIQKDLINEGAVDLAGLTAREIFFHLLTKTNDPFAYYKSSLEALAASYDDELALPRDDVLAALPGLALLPEEEAMYRADMKARKDANLMLAERIAGETSYLQAARDESERLDNDFCHKWCPFLIKNVAIGTATLIWDGPGYYIANALGEGAEFVWSRWEDAKAISQDYRMILDSLAYLNGAEASLTLQRINQNTMNGLYLVKTRDIAVIPQVSLGPPTQYSVGECRSWLGSKFVEDSAYTTLDLFNSTSEAVTIEAWATYQHKPGWFSSPVPQYREAPGVTLTPEEGGTLRFDYRHGAEGDAPIDPSPVSITVIGSTSTGTYLVGTLDAQYAHPQRIDSAGNPVNCLIGAPPHTAATAEQSVPTVSFPLRSWISQASGSDGHVLTAFAENPLTTALEATIAQTIPDGMAVVDAGGGTVADGKIEWSQTLGPGQPAVFSATLQPTGTQTGGMLPGAQLTFTNPDTAEVTQFNTPDRPLIPLIVADLDAAIPDSVSVSAPIDIPIQIHNRQSTTSLSGTLQLELRNSDDTPLARTSQFLTIDPSASAQITLTLDAPSTPDTYMVIGSLEGVPGIERSFASFVRVEEPPPPPPAPAITFVSHRDGNDEIYRMSPDGSNQQRLTSTSSTEGWPGMSADTAKITFWSARDGNQEIYVMDADGSNQRRLTFNNSIDEAPAWSPDGQQIAFMSTRDGNNEIYVMNADGSNQHRLTFNNIDDNAPVWSPDSQLIAFRSRRDGNDEIYVMNADGSSQRRITFNSADDRAAAWSPDGQSIAFHSRRDGNWEIYTVNADGSNPRRLTTSANTDQTPSWSPDGSQIAFMSTRNGNQDIYVMNADGSNVQRLTFNSADDHSPGWWSR